MKCYMTMSLLAAAVLWARCGAAEVLKSWDFSSKSDFMLACLPGFTVESHINPEVKTPEMQQALEIELKSLPPDAVVHGVQLNFLYSGELKAKHVYEVSFKCKASRTGAFTVAAGLGNPPWTQFASENSVQVSPKWTLCKMTFTADVDINAKLHMPRIMLAKFGAPATLWFGPVSFREVPTPLPLNLNKTWKIFIDAPELKDLSKPPSNLKAVQSSLKDNTINLAAIAGSFKEKERAYLFNEFHCDEDGAMRIGFSCDWWMSIYINGKKVYDNIFEGNSSHDFTVEDHVLEIPVKKGINVLAAKVLSGSEGWLFVCGDPQRLSDELFVVKAGPDWKAIDQSRLSVVPGTPLDFSSLVEPSRAAGEKGRLIINKDGRLAFETESDKPVRLLGFNSWHCVWFTYLWDKNALRKFAEDTARQGYNSIRFQGVCVALTGGVKGWPMPKEKQDKLKPFEEALKDEVAFDPASLDKFDYFVFCAKQNGIYLNIDLMNGGAGYCLSPDNSERGSSKDFKTNLLFKDSIQRKHWASAVRLLMDHLNPYTGVRYKDDPVIYCVEPFNEQDLLLYQKHVMHEFTPYFKEYLKTKYGSEDVLRKAWGKPEITFATVADIDEATLRKGDAQAEDAGMFLIDRMSETNTWYFSTLRGCGYKGIVSQWDMIMRAMEMPARAMMPAIALHTYFAHPTSVPTKNLVPKKSAGWGGKSCDQSFYQGSSLNSTFLRGPAAVRFLDRPFMITEYSQAVPNKYRHERGLFFGAYAALQGWDALYCHGEPVSNPIGWSKGPAIHFETPQDPISRASEVVAALAWCRGDVSEAKHAMSIKLSNKALFPKHFLEPIGDDYAKMSMLTKIGIVYPEIKPLTPVSEKKADFEVEPNEFSTSWSNQWYASTSNKDGAQVVELVRKMRELKILPDSNKTDYAKRIFQSETGEITLDGKKESMTVVTPRLEGAIIKRDGNIRLENLEIGSCSKAAMIAVASLDSESSLKEAKRLLLVFSTNALNSNMVFEDQSMRLVADFGVAPVLMETAKASLSIKSAQHSNPDVFALHLDGTRMERIPAKFENGALRLDIDTAKLPYGTVFFEIAYMEAPMKADKILILGNSITLHAPKPDIGWTTNWGMAASALEKDFAHSLLRRFPKTPEARIGNIANFERRYATCDVDAAFKPYAGFKPDIAVLAIGENIPAITTQEDKEKLRQALGALLGVIKRDGAPAIFVRSSFFADQTKDDILRQVCAEVGGTFVDISQLCKDETNYARSEKAFENKFVGAHPGDKGMAAIADAIWKAMAEKLGKRP